MGELVKIVLRGEEGEVETVWAEHVGTESHYRLENSAFYALDVSFGDTVEATPDPDDGGRLRFRRVFARSGHSTYRLIPAEGKDFQKLWAPLGEMGCTYEGHHGTLWSIDVAPSVDSGVVVEVLEAIQEAGNGWWEEAHRFDPDQRQ